MRGLIIFLVAFLLYVSSIFGGFVQDDRVVIESNQDLGSVSSLVTAWTEPYYKGDKKAGAYRPVTSFSFGLDAMFLGRSAWGFHLVSVILYSFLCWLVYLFLKEVGLNKNMAFVISLLFAVHPIHSEAVNNIVGRSEILLLIFFLLAMIFAFRKKWEITTLMYLLAIVSKESGVVAIVPLTLVLINEKSELKEKVGKYIFLIMSVVAYLGLRLSVLGQYFFSNNATMVENQLKFVSVGQRLLGAISVFLMAIEKMFWPMNLSYDYSFNQLAIPHNMLDVRVIVGGLILLFLLIGLFCYVFISIKVRQRNVFAIGIMLLLLPLSVTGNFLFASGTIFGERLWLTPSLGFLIIIVCGLKLLWVGIPKQVTTILLIVIIALFGMRTFFRNFDWKSEKTLFLHDAKYASNSVLASSNEAAMWLSEKNFEKAKVALDRAERIYPKYPQLMNNWGIYYLWQDQEYTAKQKFDECLTAHPDYELCKSNLTNMVIK